MHEITELAVCNKRAGWIFWRDSLSDQGLILGTAQYVKITNSTIQNQSKNQKFYERKNFNIVSKMLILMEKKRL